MKQSTNPKKCLNKNRPSGKRVWRYVGWTLLSVSAFMWLILLFAIPEEGEWETILCFATVISITIGLGIFSVMREQPYGKMRMISGLFISAVGSWSLVVFGKGFGLTSELIAIIPGFFAIVSGMFILISWNDMGNWPLITATITGHRIEKGKMPVHLYGMTDEQVDAFIPVIDYEYTVDSRTFNGEWKGNGYQYFECKELNQEYISLIHAQPVGKKIQIHYNRRYPDKNLIDNELGFRKAAGFGLIGGGIVLCLGGIFLTAKLNIALGLICAYVISIIVFAFSYSRICPKEWFPQYQLQVTSDIPSRPLISLEAIESYDDLFLLDLLKSADAPYLQDYEEKIRKILAETTSSRIRREAARAIERLRDWRSKIMERLI